MLNWPSYVALGDSLTVGRGDPGPGGGHVGWARRLAFILTTRTAVPCALTNLAVDRAGVADVLERQLPAVGPLAPDLISVTVGMNDTREPVFDEQSFAVGLGQLLDGLAATGATVLICTLPDIAALMPMPRGYVPIARQRMSRVSDIIREQAARQGAVCLDAWAMPSACDPAIYGPDRIHPNASGHQLIADASADLLLAS